VARLALASSADEDSPDGDEDAKQWAHGLVDAGAFVDAHDPGTPPALVLETTGGAGDDHRIGSGDGQLPHPDTTWVTYAFQAAEGVAANPGTAGFAGAVSGTAAFAAAGDDPGTFRASLDSGPLDPGLRSEMATATVDGEPASASFAVLVLEADDQAPGIDLVGGDDDAWRRVDGVDGQDLDDVDVVTLGRGDRLDVTVAGLSADPVGVLLFDAGTEDVLGQRNQSLACGGGGDVGCPTAGLHFDASSAAPTCSTSTRPGPPATTG
jgi:hypothetical protein